MKSNTIIGNTLSKHMIIVILHFLVKNAVFEQKQFNLSKLLVFHWNKSNGYRLVQKTSSENLSLIQPFSWILQEFEV